MRVTRFYPVISFTLVLLLVTGCAKQQPEMAVRLETPPNRQTTTLRFINSWGGSDPKSETLQMVFEGFTENNPDICITNESLYGEDFLVNLKTDFASGNDPDVFGLWPGSDIKTLIQVGKVADLSGVLQEDSEWTKSFDEKMWQYTTFNDKIYGLPVELIFEGLFVNTDLFRWYEVKVPTNYEELKKAVVTFREHGIIPIAYNCKSEGTYLYQNMAMMIGGKEAIEDPIRDGTIHPSYIQAMEMLRELYELDAFPEEVFTMSSVERNDLFINKKAAMIVQGSWFVSAILDDSTVEIFPFPEMVQGGDNYSSMIYGLGCGTFYMSQKAWDDPERREASIKLLKHLTSKETATLFAERTGMLSCVDISDNQIEYSKLARSGINYTYAAKSLIGPPDSYLPRTSWENVIVKDLPYILEGKLSPIILWDRVIKAAE